MFNIFGSRKSTPSFKQELARLIADNLGSQSRTVRTNEIAQMIIEKTYSFRMYVGKTYDLLVDQHGPCIIAPIVFVLATKSWKIEHSDGLSSIVQHQTQRHGFQVAKYICQCFDYNTWVNLRNSFVQGLKTNNGYEINTYYSSKSAEQQADRTRYLAVWIAAIGLSYFLSLTQDNVRSFLTSENAGILREAREGMVSIPDYNPGDLRGMFGDKARADCILRIDNWLQQQKA